MYQRGTWVWLVAPDWLASAVRIQLDREPASSVAWVARGARFFSFNFDGALLLEGSRRAMCEARDVVGERLL